jgi:regulator of replication initiation timing
MENKTIALIIVILTFILVTSVWAQVPTTADEQKQIEELKKKYASYEAALWGLLDTQNYCRKAAKEIDYQCALKIKDQLLQSCKADKPICDCQTLSTTIEALERDNRKLSSSLETSQKVVEEAEPLRQQLETVTQENQNLKASLEDLRDKLSHSAQKEPNESLSSQLDQVRKELRKKEKELREKDSENKQLRDRLNNVSIPPISEFSEEVYGVVVTKETSLNIRKGPGEGENYPIIGKAQKGSKLRILGKAGVWWYKIQGSNGSVGYVRSDYIELLSASVYANAFPKDSCGDHNPGGIHQWYPVWVDYSSENLEKIRSRYCRDAFRKRDKTDSNTYIQVASFLRESDARQFAKFMQNEVGSGGVGDVTEH